MSTRNAGREPMALRRLGERIEDWRRTRLRRTAMPEDLWSAAARLADRHGVYRVARTLRIGSAGLSRRVMEARAARVSSRAPAGFVELRGRDLLEGTESAASGEAFVEVANPSGARLTIRLGAGASIDVAAIVAAFHRGAA